jgi:hypothetical protein
LVIPNQTRQSNHPEDDATNEAPLLSDDGRDFLDGKIDADEYVGMARDIAAARARQDLYDYYLRYRRRRRRTTALVGFSLATIAYAILGVATIVSGQGGALSVAAFITAGVAGLGAVSYGLYRDGGEHIHPNMRSGLVNAIDELVDRFVVRRAKDH